MTFEELYGSGTFWEIVNKGSYMRGIAREERARGISSAYATVKRYGEVIKAPWRVTAEGIGIWSGTRGNA